MAEAHKLRIPAAAGEGAAREAAKRLFLERVRGIEGVVEIELYGGRSLADQSLFVYLRPDDEATEDEVYELKKAVYEQYPDTYLDVHVRLARDEA